MSRRAEKPNSHPRRTRRPRASVPPSSVPAVANRVDAPPANRRKPRAQPARYERDVDEAPERQSLLAGPKVEFHVRLAGIRSAFWSRTEGPLRAIAKVVVAIALVAGGVAGYRLLDGYMRTADYFAVTELAVTGSQRLETEAVFGAAGVAEGDNIFSRSAEEMEERLRRHPWIAASSVERRLPGRVTIEIVEHLPVAVLSTEAGLYLVADDGVIFKELSPGDPTDLPVLTGVDPTSLRAGGPVLLDVVTLLHEYEASGLHRREPIDEVHLEADGGLTLFAGGDGMMVRLGRAPFRRKFRRLRQVLDRIEASEARAEYIYLDNVRRRDRATVRLRELPEPPPLAEESPT